MPVHLKVRLGPQTPQGDRAPSSLGGLARSVFWGDKDKGCLSGRLVTLKEPPWWRQLLVRNGRDAGTHHVLLKHSSLPRLRPPGRT
ncbi:hypothetical protein COCON_G00088080 [Conger conger]|uniref:Uncharacterized protein n=1 Tax=Conger conger TaxID=82655 RepID=A0A9Q1DKF1_CONCO|nr:hypothetical protein COCON_G00088080 [Conger conger]